MHGESRERPQHAIIREERRDTAENSPRGGQVNGEVGGASGEWIKSGGEGGGGGMWRGIEGEAEGEEGGEGSTDFEGSGVLQERFHQQEWGRVVVKLSGDCHHLLNTDVTDGGEEENAIGSTLSTLCVSEMQHLNINCTTCI